jgi:segregation and condensation protein A
MDDKMETVAELRPEALDSDSSFTLRLDNFEGPFDLLLKLIAKHKLDITEVALSKVTDEFIAHVSAGGALWPLEQTSAFLVVAATLLDMKAAKLLPGAQVEDEEDIADFEARDLLFSRLLQYRAFKSLAGMFSGRIAAESLFWPRPGGLEPEFATLLPDVVIPGGADRLARVVTRLFSAPDIPQVSVEHLHVNVVSVVTQAGIIAARLSQVGKLTFTELVDGVDRMTVVARFLAILELYKEGALAFRQSSALGKLTLEWTGEVEGDVIVRDEYDDGAHVLVPVDALPGGLGGEAVEQSQHAGAVVSADPELGRVPSIEEQEKAE